MADDVEKPVSSLSSFYDFQNPLPQDDEALVVVFEGPDGQYFTVAVRPHEPFSSIMTELFPDVHFYSVTFDDGQWFENDQHMTFADVGAYGGVHFHVQFKPLACLEDVKCQAMNDDGDTSDVTILAQSLLAPGGLLASLVNPTENMDAMVPLLNKLFDEDESDELLTALCVTLGLDVGAAWLQDVYTCMDQDGVIVNPSLRRSTHTLLSLVDSNFVEQWSAAEIALIPAAKMESNLFHATEQLMEGSPIGVIHKETQKKKLADASSKASAASKTADPGPYQGVTVAFDFVWFCLFVCLFVCFSM